VCGGFFYHNFGPLGTNWDLFKHLSIFSDHILAFITTVYHLLMANSSRIFPSSQTVFLNITMSSLYYSKTPDLNPVVQIWGGSMDQWWLTPVSIVYGTVHKNITHKRLKSRRIPHHMRWNGRLASWICRNCVMLSCLYGPKSMRNVSSVLLDLCHKGPLMCGVPQGSILGPFFYSPFICSL